MEAISNCGASRSFKGVTAEQALNIALIAAGLGAGQRHHLMTSLRRIDFVRYLFGASSRDDRYANLRRAHCPSFCSA